MVRLRSRIGGDIGLGAMFIFCNKPNHDSEELCQLHLVEAHNGKMRTDWAIHKYECGQKLVNVFEIFVVEIRETVCLREAVSKKCKMTVRTWGETNLCKLVITYPT